MRIGLRVAAAGSLLLGGLTSLLFTAAIGAADAPALRVSTDAELARALAACRPGDTIVLADGTYTEQLSLTRGGSGPDRRITVKAEHPRRAVISRKGMAARLEGSFLRLEGLVLDSQYGNASGVRARGKSIQLVDCEVRRAGTVDGPSYGDGVQFYDGADGLVERCHIHHCLASRAGQRVDSHGLRFTHCRDMVVRDCFIDLISGDCVQVDPNRQEWDNILIERCRLSGGKVAADDPLAHPGFAAGTYTSENAVDTKCSGKGRPRLTVRDCVVWGFRGPIGNAAAFNIKEKCDAVLDRCTIYDCEIGLRLRGPAWVRVSNCVLYDNDTHCRYEDRIPRLHLAHCTFGPTTGKGRGHFHEQRPSPDLRVQGCLFVGELPRQAADPSNAKADRSAFVDAARHDYRLKAPLPVRGPVEPAAPDLKVDRAGAPRADRPDAGAYQH